MPVLLQLDSSADLEQSRTRALTRAFADAWLASGEEFTVVEHDLHLDQLPHLGDAALHWPKQLRRKGATVPMDAAKLQRETIAELLAADAVLIGAPMYNYSMPSTLKAWIDHIHVPGVTASYEGSARPLEGRPVVVMTSRGGAYDAGTVNEGRDHGIPPLELILADALGMDFTVVTASLQLADDLPGLADQLDRSHTELDAALARAAALGASTAAQVLA